MIHRNTTIGEGENRFRAPVFVLGCPRSGTTLLYHMLLSSGGFAIYQTETHVFNMLLPRFGDLAYVRNRQRLMDFWLGSDFFKRSGLQADAIRKRVEAGCRSGGDFLRIVMGAMAENQKVCRWADSTPAHLLHMAEIKREIPEALFLHVLRDGRDVALSLDKLGWIKPFPWNRNQSLLAAGIFWEWMVEQGRKTGATLGGDYMEVRFEDLVARPEETLACIEPFLSHRLDYEVIQNVGIGSVRRPNSSFKVDSTLAAFSPVGRWKDRFLSDDLANFEGLLAAALTRLGYALSSKPAPVPPALRRMRYLYRLYCAGKHRAKATALSRYAVSLELHK